MPNLKWQDFESLQRYRRILVTGPQRSGTQIVGRMIAAATGFWFYSCKDWSADGNGLSSFLENTSVVWQQPSMVGCAYALRCEYNAIVFVNRNYDDILKSQERIGWNSERLEMLYLSCPWLDGPSARHKQRLWKDYLGNLENFYTVDYAQLADHPLFIQAESRKGFGSMQWQKEG